VGESNAGNPAQICAFHFRSHPVRIDVGLAAGIASAPFLAQGSFLMHWLMSWLLSWMLMLPVVVLAAPVIRGLANALTREDV